MEAKRSQDSETSGVVRFYAHTKGPNKADWELLEAHLDRVAERAAAFAAKFDSTDWGRLAGRWHDLGKYQRDFQSYLERSAHGLPARRVPHAGAGARHAWPEPKKGPAGMPLAFVIAAHHAGLPNQSDGKARRSLYERLDDAKVTLEAARPNIPPVLLDALRPTTPPAFLQKPAAREEDSKRRHEFWIRFLFSALVDADRLATQEFCEPEDAEIRRAARATIPALRAMLDDFIARKLAGISPEARDSKMNVARGRVLAECRAAAAQSPGFFSLTVPTGGGKTLASMAFALLHAERHGLDRAIVVLPFTSIIEQNAKVYRDALGHENVLEHHSNLDPERARKEREDATAEELDDAERRRRWAAENWDAPVVVTTTVQFFESLFSAHPGRCRKLHNIARSVIVLDEVQTLPPNLLVPILDGMRELVGGYGCTIVLSTATPPALRKREKLSEGLENVRSMLPDAGALYRDLRRVRYEWPSEKERTGKAEDAGRSWEALAEELAREPRVLAIVHRRQDARDLTLALDKELGEAQGKESTIHLSALMCPAHRSLVIQEIGKRLKGGGPCRVVSTQLVEAGVDLDFPVVYRALGGLDSIVQAAGRCNREGRLAEGRVVVFRACTEPPRGTPRSAMETTLGMLKARAAENTTPDVENPAIFEDYFRRFYRREVGDDKGIQPARADFRFEEVGEKFRLIDEETCTVLVRFSEGCLEDEPDLIDEALRLSIVATAHPGALRATLRKLQRRSVTVYHAQVEILRKTGVVVPLGDSDELFVVSPLHSGTYDSRFGLRVDPDALPDPASLIVS